MATSFSEEYKKSKNKLSNKIIEAIERGMKYTSMEYNDALSKIDVANAYFKQFFHDYDAILTPSANGEPTQGLQSTGDPIFSTIWTYCGMPSISLPLLQGKNKLPIGIQLVSSLYDDERLFRNASWLTNKIKAWLNINMKISEKLTIILGIFLFGTFVIGLAWSISTGLAGFWRGLPFWIIVLFVLFLLLYDSLRAIKK